jgi:histone H3/H4
MSASAVLKTGLKTIADDLAAVTEKLRGLSIADSSVADRLKVVLNSPAENQQLLQRLSTLVFDDEQLLQQFVALSREIEDRGRNVHGHIYRRNYLSDSEESSSESTAATLGENSDDENPDCDDDDNVDEDDGDDDDNVDEDDSDRLSDDLEENYLAELPAAKRRQVRTEIASDGEGSDDEIPWWQEQKFEREKLADAFEIIAELDDEKDALEGRLGEAYDELDRHETLAAQELDMNKVAEAVDAGVNVGDVHIDDGVVTVDDVDDDDPIRALMEEIITPTVSAKHPRLDLEHEDHSVEALAKELDAVETLLEAYESAEDDIASSIARVHGTKDALSSLVASSKKDDDDADADVDADDDADVDDDGADADVDELEDEVEDMPPKTALQIIKVAQNRFDGEIEKLLAKRPELKRKRKDCDAITEIRVEQRRTDRTLGDKPFFRLAREVLSEIDGSLVLSEEASIALQEAAEEHLRQRFGDANLRAITDGRDKIFPADMTPLSD